MERYVVNRLIESMGALSDKELRELAEVLEHPHATASLPKLIREILALRQTERHMRKKRQRGAFFRKNQDESVGIKKDAGEAAAARNMQTEQTLKDMFFQTLQNRSLFPSTRDVIGVMKTFFGLPLAYDNYRRRGRLAAVQKCWKHLSRLPGSKRWHLLTRFFEHLRYENRTHTDYGELFRILTHRE